ncbi:DMT family transporter [Paenibacillus eucommiae]|uniref:Paired small multidrug resistance pump n=1 Tax=Paenibacillus eucommiae TaxID=1355755 RepID=A0ABS4J6T8_9BACL|nr:SMR family transporter [Paenibacillus eucommiae]MBP1995538.1 paired small multidrug resistance pump [Paenibacillus eucommiae]
MSDKIPLEKTDKKDKVISKNKAWLYVALGGALEIVWASGFKYEAVPQILVLISLLTSFDLIIRATKVLPVGTVYAVFAGLGTVGTVIVEAIAEGSISAAKIGLILMLLLFIFGLKLTAGKEGIR